RFDQQVAVGRVEPIDQGDRGVQVGPVEQLAGHVLVGQGADDLEAAAGGLVVAARAIALEDRVDVAAELVVAPGGQSVGQVEDDGFGEGAIVGPDLEDPAFQLPGGGGVGRPFGPGVGGAAGPDDGLVAAGLAFG